MGFIFDCGLDVEEAKLSRLLDVGREQCKRMFQDSGICSFELAAEGSGGRQ